MRQLAQIAGGYGGLSMVGTPKTIADEMEEWLHSGGCDGFNIMFPYVPGGLDDFVDRVVPELQRRGLFRTEYEGRTLRENLGLPRPREPVFPARAIERRRRQAGPGETDRNCPRSLLSNRAKKAPAGKSSVRAPRREMPDKV